MRSRVCVSQACGSTSFIFAVCKSVATVAQVRPPPVDPANNAFFRVIVKLESLCNPSSSVCKHWKHVFVSNATRATLSGDRGFDTVAGQVDRTDLEGRAPHHLFRPQRAGLDQSPDHMAAYARRLRRFGQSEPFAILFRGPISVDVAHASHRRETFRRPGFALTERQAH